MKKNNHPQNQDRDEFETDEDSVAYLSFAQQQEAATAGEGWLQGRYYSEEGQSVRDYLSFNEVFDICPFEVGVNRRAERRAWRERLEKVTRLLELKDLLPRPFVTLSNGEMRRVLFARALLKGPKKLVLDDPMAGLDPTRRERFKKIVSALSRDGIKIELRVRNRDELPVSLGGTHKESTPTLKPKRKSSRGKSSAEAPIIINLKNINVRFGRRILFKNFNWTIRQGEHWVLKGQNGSGKTTLLALITGDSPLGYANDVTVFGQPRKPGYELKKIRSRIGAVSPEMQTYLGHGPEELVEAALAAKPDLLLLDEPCLNLNAKEAKRLLQHVTNWLNAHPTVTAICIAHRADHVPLGFDHLLDLDAL